MLEGEVVAAPGGIHGFDCNTKLDPVSIQALRAAGFAFAVRYVARGGTPGDVDLDADEAETILDGGLALMLVQHVERAPWQPDATKGKTYGENAVQHALTIGIPTGINLWLDLEGVSGAVSSDTVIAYCNAWFNAVAAGGYVPGLYVGANGRLTGDQLYWQLRTQHYWRSGSTVPDIPQRGYCMIQRIQADDVVGGVAIDRNLTRADALGNTPIWLTRSALGDGDVPEDLPPTVAVVVPPPPPGGNPLAVTAKLPQPSPGLTHYYTDKRLYGVPLAIAALVEIGRIWDLRRPGALIGIGDISLENGGPISGHASHRKGVDLDLRMMQANGDSAAMVYTAPGYSRTVTQELVDLFYGNGVLAVQLIFFNDSRIVGAQHWPNHDNHLHVRFHLPGTQPAFPLLALGSKGAAVRELQRRLGFWAAKTVPPTAGPGIDGDFGDLTLKALTDFQTALKLTADGKAGEDSWKALPLA